MKTLRKLFFLIFRTLTGADIRKMRELEAVMHYWHKEEFVALSLAKEALECGNTERFEMWFARAKEARLRCNKDFRQPMIQLTGHNS